MRCGRLPSHQMGYFPGTDTGCRPQLKTSDFAIDRNRFDPMFAIEIRKKRAERLRSGRQWQWHLDEMFVKIYGVGHYLWRAVDQEG